MRHSKLALNIVAAVSLGASFAAYAQSSGSPTTRSGGASSEQGAGPASRSWIPYTSYGYVGGSIGRSDFDLGGCAPGFSCDNEDRGFKIYTGGRFSRTFGIELGYVNLGEAGRNGGEVKAQGANLSLIGNIPLGERFNLFGKIGGIYSWTKTGATAPGVATGDDDGLGLSYGAGMQFDFNRNWALRADWDRYRLKYVNQREDADMYSLGVVLKF